VPAPSSVTKSFALGSVGSLFTNLFVATAQDQRLANHAIALISRTAASSNA
jgi:hypothetical protein